MHLHTYIDIHKHDKEAKHENDVFAIYNKYNAFQALSPERQYSLGIHPWYIQDPEAQFDNLKKAVYQSEVIAVGECGLDAMRGVSLELQATLFQRQIRLANECGKPLIIHCVRAFPQALSLLKHAKVPVVFHGFNKKSPVANDILKHGYYLSFGADILKDNTAAFAVFAHIPANRFFLETDDSLTSIKEIYQTAARIRKTAEDAIILQVQENFKTAFSL